LFNFDRNTLIITASVLIIISALIFIYIGDIEIGLLNWFGDIIYNTISPFLNLLNDIYSGIFDFFNTLFSINEVNQELKELRQKNSTLERQIMFLQYIGRENTRLRRLLDFQEKVDYEMLGAEVTANSPSIWEKVITINRGKSDGIKERMPVITYDGYLVGRIEYAGSSSSQVRLMIDNKFVVGGVVARSNSREIGLVKGSGRIDRLSTMDNIAWDADIEKGDIIYSSGLSNNFPAGLKIGEVISVDADNYGLSQKAKVELFMNTVTLEEVMVITNFN